MFLTLVRNEFQGVFAFVYMSESEAMILCQEKCVNQQLKDLGPEVLPSLFAVPYTP